MIRHAITMAAVAALAHPVLLVTAVAQEAVNGRYTMSQTPEGYLKLDSRTGEVTECRRNGDQGYRCTLTPDERAALQAEIDRLASENARLRLAAQAPGAAPPAGGTTPGPGAVPSDQDFDRAMTMMERFMRRFMALMKEEQAKPPASP